MQKTVQSNPDVRTTFFYWGANVVGIVVKENDTEINEDYITFDTNEEAQEYFDKLEERRCYG